MRMQTPPAREGRFFQDSGRIVGILLNWSAAAAAAAAVAPGAGAHRLLAVQPHEGGARLGLQVIRSRP